MRKRKDEKERKGIMCWGTLLDKVCRRESQFVYSGCYFFFFSLSNGSPSLHLCNIHCDVIGGKGVSCGCLFIWLGSWSFHFYLPFVNFFRVYLATAQGAYPTELVCYLFKICSVIHCLVLYKNLLKSPKIALSLKLQRNLVSPL